MSASGTGFGNVEVLFKMDEITGEKVPVFKFMLGGLGADGGYVSSANPMPISAPATGIALSVSSGVVDELNPLPVYIGSAIETTASYLEDSPHTSGDMGIFMLGLRSDSDVPTANDGDYTALKLDEAGRLKVSTQPASYTDTIGNITANAQTVFLNVDRSSNVTISMVATSLVGHNATFEYSNNSTNGTDGNWYGVQVVRTNANTVETATGVLAATPIYGWEVSVNAYKWFRVRATAHTSGTAAYSIKQGTYATEPVPAIQVTGTQPVSGTVTATVGAATLALPTTVADVASAALTTTTTTAALTPSAGTSYSVVIPVTVVSGTTPTLDVMVQESDDSGTNWFDVFQFPRITATGIYRSPPLRLRGNRVRYVQTVTGTTPSFTRAINRLQRQCTTDQYCQLFDRAVSLTTLNATTTALNIQGTNNADLVINLGTATTPPAIQLEGSDDNINWYALGSPLTGVASSTVKLSVNNIRCGFLRARVSTVGATVVAGYVLIKGY